MAVLNRPDTSTSGVRIESQPFSTWSWNELPIPAVISSSTVALQILSAITGSNLFPASGAASTTPLAAQVSSVGTKYATFVLPGQRLKLTRREMLMRSEAILRQAEAYRLALVEVEGRGNTVSGGSTE